jgi:beta-1,4-N-acetylglucosaminyltransferase
VSQPIKSPSSTQNPNATDALDVTDVKGVKSTPVMLAIFGAGGHRTEMHLLLNYFVKANRMTAMPLISIGPSPLDCGVVAHYQITDVRDKHSRFKSLLLVLPSVFKQVGTTLKILRAHKVNAVLSTGPGLCIIPMLVMRLFGVKTVFVETYCRFNSRSFTGRVMCKLAHRFLVQNKQQLDLYPGAEYCGRV